MATAVSMPRLPSAAEIEKALREKMPGLKVYNPSREWVPAGVFGLTVYLAPDLQGAIDPHPVTGRPVKCDGRTEIKGRWLTQKDSSGKVIEGQDAPSMVKYLLSPENYGQMGIVWLPGESEEQDAKLIEASQAVFTHHQQSFDEQIVSRRAEFKKNWLKGPRKSEPVPPPTPAETAAMDRLQQRKRAAAYTYECTVPDCPGYAVNEWDRFVAHMKLAHRINPDRSKYDGPAVGFQETPEKPAPETPETAEDPKSAIAEAARVLAARTAEAEAETARTADEAEDTPVARQRKKK